MNGSDVSQGGDSIVKGQPLRVPGGVPDPAYARSRQPIFTLKAE